MYPENQEDLDLLIDLESRTEQMDTYEAWQNDEPAMVLVEWNGEADSSENHPKVIFNNQYVEINR